MQRIFARLSDTRPRPTIDLTLVGAGRGEECTQRESRRARFALRAGHAGASLCALSAGGRVIIPFEETFWSPGYGALVDKFGIPWMVNTFSSGDWKPMAG